MHVFNNEFLKCSVPQLKCAQTYSASQIRCSSAILAKNKDNTVCCNGSSHWPVPFLLFHSENTSAGKHSALREEKQRPQEWQSPLEANGYSFYGTEIGSVTGGCVSQGSGQLVPQNATVAGCPALSPFYGTHSWAPGLIDGGADEQIMCPPKHVKWGCRPRLVLCFKFSFKRCLFTHYLLV